MMIKMIMGKKLSRQDKLRPLYLLLIIVLFIWIASIFLLNKNLQTLIDRGMFGDSFGAINSLFSGLAFAGIIYTILLQRKELSLQREELKETRIELKRSADSQEKAERQFKRQSENLKITAKLNALSTLVTYYTDIIHMTNTPRHRDAKKNKIAIEERESCIAKIKTMLDIKESLN